MNLLSFVSLTMKERCEMITRILVPLDESALAEQAIPVAARIARASLCSILLIRVIDTNNEFGAYMNAPATVLVQDTIDRDIADATRYLAKIAKSPALAGIKTDVEVFTGSPAARILDVARVEHEDLIIMCSHGETGIKRWMMGNVTHKVVRHSPVPVLVLRSGKDGSIDLCTQSTKLVRVLVPLDGSPLSETVLEPLAQLVAKLTAPGQCHINLLRVVDMPNRYTGLNGYPHIDSEMLKDAKIQVKLYMQSATDHLHAELARTLSPSNFTITSSCKIETDIPSTIINVAEYGDDGEEGVGGYDLIAMATHGRDAIPRWALGSVTERVLDSTKLPLLIVRPHAMQA
jgi:nucleotide-binding universal stress UspA family protein